jgi:hypothetical protein
MVVTNPLAVGPSMRIISDLRLQYWLGKNETEPHHIGPRGGTADASVLGADSGIIHISRREANTSDTASHLSIGASVSRDGMRTEATASEHRVLPRMLPGMLPGDSAKATIDAAWDLLPEDVKSQILAIVQDAMKRGDGE